jgi:ABC-2 type transport system ATP-binding protein
MSALSFEGVRRGYGRASEVLRDVSFSLEPSEIVGLLGRNGAGKTTLMNLAMGLLEAEAGRVRTLGLDPRRDAVAMKRRVGYVSEDQILPPNLRVGEAIAFHRQLFPTWDRALEKSLLERFPLPANARISTLSKGQARQLALLCAVAHRPELLILDEPAGGLDPAARREFLETSIQLLNEAGTAILFSSHYMSDVERMAGRILMLEDGRVLIDQPLDSLREDYTLALVEGAGADLEAKLRRLTGCVCVRRRGGLSRAVFRLGPDECRALLARETPDLDARCVTLGLEELFVEIAGGRS